MKKKWVRNSVIFLCILLIQGCSLSKQIKKADRRYEMGEYTAAATMYKRIASRIPSKDKPLRGKIFYKLGNCYRLTNNNVRAEAAYRSAIRFKVEEKDVYLFYAEVLRKNERIKEAATNYRRYLNYGDSTNIWALNGLESCAQIREWKTLPKRYAVKTADFLNDRKGASFSPVVGDDDGSVIYLTSSRVAKGQKGVKNSKITGIRNNDIYCAKRKLDGKWEEVKALPENINTDYDEGACSMSSDGKSMYYTLCQSIPNQTIGAEIYVSKRSGGEWSDPKKIKIFEDSTITTAHPAISPDGDYLYFVSDKEGGYGGKDIWRCKKKDEEWIEPENLGPSINTPGDEMFPTFRANGTLYFSSNGLPGLGGLDIFEAKIVGTDSLEKPIFAVRNMMMPINSSGDDFGISFIGRSNNGYFSSNRNDPKGYDKIYSFGQPDVDFAVTGKVLDYRGNPITDAVIRIVGDDGTNAKVYVKKDGSYSFKLNKNVDYVMQATARGHLNDKGNFSTVGVYKTKSYTYDFKLPSLQEPVKIENIFFDFGRYNLTKSSEEALQGLVKMLKDNPNVTIEIGAHTDYIATAEYNLTLSSKRAESVINYLMSQGIDSDRLTSKGYGESKPVVVTEAIAQEHPFLKEGETLTEEYISTLSDKQKEVANQINRRIEFTVLKTTYKMY